MLKDSIKKRNMEQETQKKHLSESNKQIKLTEKENYNLQKRIDNFADTMKNLKDNIKELKRDKLAADKTVQVLEKKLRTSKEKTGLKQSKVSNTFPATTEVNISLSKFNGETFQNNNSISQPSSTISLLSSNNCFSTSELSSTLIKSTLSSSSLLPSATSTCKAQEITTISESAAVNPTSFCSHVPQCKLRNSFSPPQCDPLRKFCPPTKPKPPKNIRIFPIERLSYQKYWDLASTHECEECEPGMLFHNYIEKVEYDDPEASGMVIRTALYTCPNHPKATGIEVEKETITELKKQDFECSVCGNSFSSLQNSEFHKRRTH